MKRLVHLFSFVQVGMSFANAGAGDGVHFSRCCKLSVMTSQPIILGAN
jgi:hypothetical protein